MYDNEPKIQREITKRYFGVSDHFSVYINGLMMVNKIIGFMLVLQEFKWIVSLPKMVKIFLGMQFGTVR
jgi:hypothetical protein